MPKERIRMGDLANINQLQLNIGDENEKLTPDEFVARYKEFLPLYVSGAMPRQDTLKTYEQHIDKFIEVCKASKCHPLAIKEYQILQYVQKLRSTGHTLHGISIRVSSIRNFYGMAKRLGFVSVNPCKNVHVGASFQEDEQFTYFSVEQVQEIFDKLGEESVPYKRLRNQSAFLLMACEGLRLVEVHRMNDEDIDWDHKTIFVHGKGHDGTIMPSDTTMTILSDYINARPTKEKEDGYTPTFVSFAPRNYGKRIQRDGMRKTMAACLVALGYKKNGVSCHAFRHSCGTNLYAATKDLRVVQETLRQRDPKVTARYAHVQDRMNRRATSKISPVLSDSLAKKETS